MFFPPSPGTVRASVSFAPLADYAARVDAYLKARVKAHQFSGNILVAVDGRPIVRKGYGFADRQRQLPNTPGTKFKLASVTKQFTAAAILRLQDQGLLRVQDPLGKYLPACPPAWRRVRLHHLLTHTSGISPGSAMLWVLAYEMSPATALLTTFKELHDRPLDSAPGTRFAYNNFGYVLLGCVVEKASGTTYEAFLRKELFSPAGMTNTGFDRRNTAIKGLARGYGRSDGGKIVVSEDPSDQIMASGGVYSTIDDLLRWDQALSKGRVLSGGAYKALLTPYKEDYGYGWFVDRYEGFRRTFHTGGVSGFSCEVARYPDEKLCIVVLGNFEFAGDYRSVADALASFAFKGTKPQ